MPLVCGVDVGHVLSDVGGCEYVRGWVRVMRSYVRWGAGGRLVGGGWSHWNVAHI